MTKQNHASEGSDLNIMYATVAVLLCSAVGAVSVAFIADNILSSFANSPTMALLITDAGLKSDDANLERQLTTATMGLRACRDLGWALAVGCLGVGVAVFLRFRRANAS